MIKPFLGIDLTDNKRNDQQDGGPFSFVATSSASLVGLKTSVEKADQVMEKAKLPLPLRVVQWVCLIAWVAIAGGMIKGFALESLTPLRAYREAPWMFHILGGAFLVWFILWFIGHRHEKTVMAEDESVHAMAGVDGQMAGIYAELGVPETATEVDILSVTYKVKNGEVKPVEKALELSPYNNFPYRLYADEQAIYLADLEGRYTIPRTALTAIRTVNKRITLPDWNKDTPPRKGEYKPYKITVNDDNDVITCKPYHILDVVWEGECWGIYFPCYELPAFQAATGLTAEE